MQIIGFLMRRLTYFAVVHVCNKANDSFQHCDIPMSFDNVMWFYIYAEERSTQPSSISGGGDTIFPGSDQLSRSQRTDQKLLQHSEKIKIFACLRKQQYPHNSQRSCVGRKTVNSLPDQTYVTYNMLANYVTNNMLANYIPCYH